MNGATTTQRTPDAWRSLFAEARAVESGQHARWSDERRCFLVASESEPGVSREVTVSGLRFADRRVFLVFACSCPNGRLGRQAPYGMTFCRHAAVVARRLERMRLARWSSSDNRWHAVGALAAAALADGFDASSDPPATVQTAGQRARRPLPDNDTLADQLKAGL